MKKTKPEATKPQATEETKGELSQENNDLLTDQEADKVSGGTSPRDAASGLATGKRQHKPFSLKL